MDESLDEGQTFADQAERHRQRLVRPRAMHTEYTGKPIRLVRALAEGDLVALHTHQTWPGDDQYVTMDFFRFDARGKIVEHWDAIQSVPAETTSGHTMF
jgi:predicted SnoaL-like aldol condensation-catalyzing enzyme